MVKFIKNHKILLVVLTVLSVFVTFNLIRQRNVHKVTQTNTPSQEEVQKAINAKPEDPVVQEVMPAKNPVIREATFINGAKAYKGQGEAKIVNVDGKPVVQFNDGFKTSSGPDLQVYLSKNADPKSQGLGEHVSLGGLKSTEGAQVYSLPEDHANYATVLVWCRAFPSVFTQATFN